MKYSYPQDLTHYIAIFYILLLITSCSNPKEKDRDHLVFRYNEYSNIKTLDPAFARNPSIIWPTNQLFNGLVQFDDDLNIQADIAKKWTISEDGLSYIFTLRNDVFFHKHKLCKVFPTYEK